MYENLMKIKNTNIEYNVLPNQFFLLTLWGIWCPTNCSLKMKNINNLIFTSVFFLNTVMCSEMIIYIFKSIGTLNFKLVNIFLTSASMTGIYKSISIKSSSKSLRSLIRKFFNHKSFDSQNLEEDLIHESSQRQVSKVIIIYSASMTGIFVLNAIVPIVSSSQSVMQLPVDAWYAYSIEKLYIFWLTYFHQLILGTSLICVHIGIDTLLVGLLLKISCQFNLMKSRLQNAASLADSNSEKLDHSHAQKRKIIFECINQHNYIYRFGNDINNKFQVILVLQVITSIPNLCINVYTLSTSAHVDMDYVSTFFNATASFTQLFLTCWYGNEVSLNSLQVKNAIYGMDWTVFDVATQKLLIVIMARSSKPLTFSVGYIIPMNLESLITIMKTSYSAFNLLQRTSH